MNIVKRPLGMVAFAIVASLALNHFVNIRISSAIAAQLPAPVSIWRTTNGPRDAQAAALATMAGQLFAATTTGVWASSDNGQNWQQRNTGLPEIFSGVSSLAVIETTLFAATETGIYRTNDAGAHWQAINVGLPSYFSVPQLLADGSKLYLSTYGNGLFSSADKGESWTPLQQGLPTIAAFAAAASGSSLWVATLFGIFRSTDGGQSWTRANQGLPVNAIANALTIASERVFATLGSNSNTKQGASPRGVFAFDEKSGTWLAVNEGLGTANIITFFNQGPELYAGADQGLFRFETAKASWVPLNNGLRGNVTALTANGTNLFAASGGDIFISSNRGESWTALNATFAPVQFATGFATNAAGLYVATPSGIYFRPNDAPLQLWKHANQGLTDSYIYDITTQGQNLWAISYNGQAFFSNSNGTAWRNISNGLSGQNLLSIASTESAVFIGTTKGGVYNLKTSVTAQDTWTATNQGLTGLTVRDLLAVGSTVYAATDKGIFSTTNAGASWSLVSGGLADTEKAYEPYSLAADGPTIYAVYGLRNQNPTSTIDLRFQTNPNPVFRSTDNGTNWSRVELRTDVPANFKQVLPTTQGLLALGPGAIPFGPISTDDYAEVWFSDNKGKSWSAADQGLANAPILSDSFIGITPFRLTSALLGATATQAFLTGSNNNITNQGIYVRDLVSMTCRYEVSGPNDSSPLLPLMDAPSTASTITLKVRATSNTCAWNAESQSDWITIASGLSGAGNGEVRLDIAANSSTQSRIGILKIAGKYIQVGQTYCTLAITPNAHRIESAGGTGSLRITGASTCKWEIKNEASWVSVPATSGAGDATVNFTVAPNPNNQSRQAILYINDQTVSITQAAAQGSCATLPINPNQWVTGTITDSDCKGGTNSDFRPSNVDFYSLTAQSQQVWTATIVGQNGQFIGFYPPDIFVEAANGSPLTSSRIQSEFPALSQYQFTIPSTGKYTIIVAYPALFTPSPYFLRLAVADCAVTLPKTSTTLPATSSSDSIAVKSEGTCAWQAVSTVSWLRLQSNQSGNGDGSIPFTVEANLGAARTGNVLINNRAFVVAQAASENAPRTLTGLNPSYVEAGSTGLLLNVTGSNFTSDSKVLWGEQALATTFVSATQLRAALPAANLVTPGEVLVSVETSAPSLWRTPALPFVVRPMPQFWTSVKGPGTGDVTAVHQQGSRWWAGTSNGRVFTSTDGGQTWQRSGNLENKAIQSFASSDKAVYAATSETIYQYDLTQRVPSWGSLHTIAENDRVIDVSRYVNGLAIKGNNVFALINGRLCRLSQFSWNPLPLFTNDPNTFSVLSLAVGDSLASDALYVLQTGGIETTGGQLAQRLWITNNEGQTWRQVNLPFTPDKVANTFGAFTFSTRVYAFNRQVFFATSQGVFRLNDREQVEQVGNAPNQNGTAPENVTALAFAGDTLYASSHPAAIGLPNDAEPILPPAIFRLEANGNWAAAGEGLSDRYVQALTASTSGLLAGTASGIWLSTNRGNTWTERNQGLAASNIYHFATIGNALFIAGDQGIYRSVNNGQSWTRADIGLPLQANASASIDAATGTLRSFPNRTLSASPTAFTANGDTLYAAFPEGVFRSTDQGQSWRNTGLVGYTGNAFGFAGQQVLTGAFKGISGPVASGQPGVITSLAPLLPYNFTDFGVYRSANGTGNWTTNTGSLFGDLPTAFATLGNKVFVASTRSGIRVSDDGGQTWRVSNSGLSTGNISTLVAAGNTLLAGTAEGVFRSTDQRQSWRLVNATPYPVATMAAQNDSVYLRSNNTVYRSSDFGETWTQLPTANEYAFTSLQPLGTRLFAGTIGDGVIVANLAPGVATAVNAASYAGGELAPNSMATLFGTNLSTATMLATSADLPEELAGTRVIVRGTNGYELAAKLFFVSPGQINFLLPQMDTNAVPSQIFVVTPNGTQAVADIRLSATALGLFTANGNGQGAPAAVALRVKDGVSTYEPVTRFDNAQNRFVPLPLDVSAANGTLYLVLFGTGIDRNAVLSKVTATIGDQAANVIYAGPQGGFVGLDQLNLSVPASLAGRGELDLKVTVNAKAANTLRVAFK